MTKENEKKLIALVEDKTGCECVYADGKVIISSVADVTFEVYEGRLQMSVESLLDASMVEQDCYLELMAFIHDNISEIERLILDI